MSVAKISQAGDATQPSPSVWRDCRMSLLNDLGLGRYDHRDFFAVETDATAELTVQDGYRIEADTGGEVAPDLPANTTGGRMRVVADTDQDDGISMFQQVGEGMVINSGLKVWFEARVALENVAQDASYFFGLAEEAAFDVDCLLDANVSIGAESVFGFLYHGGDDTTAIDAIFNLDTGTGTAVMADITRNAAYTKSSAADTGAADYPSGANVFYKFGLRFDGQDKLEYSLNGHIVSRLTLVSGTHPVGVNMGPILAHKSGAAGPDAFIVDWVRWAYQERT